MDGFLKPNDKMLKRHRRSVFLDNKINLTFNAANNTTNGLSKQGNVVDKKVLNQVRYSQTTNGRIQAISDSIC